jgi:hypothetical protein
MITAHVERVEHPLAGDPVGRQPGRPRLEQRRQGTYSTFAHGPGALSLTCRWSQAAPLIGAATAGVHSCLLVFDGGSGCGRVALDRDSSRENELFRDEQRVILGS